MSLPIVKIQDPKLDIVPRVYYAQQGAASLTHQQVTATSATQSQVKFTAYTPSVNVGVDRRMYMEYTMRFTFGVNADGVPLPNVVSTSTGFRQYPIASTIESINLKLNNSTISQNLDDIIHALHRYGTNAQERNHYMSGSPAYPDQMPAYINNTQNWSMDITSGGRNPFVEYSSNPIEVTRNIKPWVYDVVYGTGGQDFVRSFDVTFREPIFLPLLNWSDHEALCLFGIQTIDLTVSHSSFLRMLEGAWDVGDVPSSITIEGKPILHLFFVSPQLNQEIPKLLTYPYYEIGRYVTTTDRVLLANIKSNTPSPTPESAGCTNQVTINNIQLQSIPKRIYIFAQPKRTTESPEAAQYPNCFGRINNISINWNSVAGRLSTCRPSDLYRMSVKNGLDMSWLQFSRFCGSVLCVVPSLDLGISPLESGGSRGSYQLAYNMSFTNLFNDDLPYDVYTVPIAEGFCTINDSFVSVDVGVLTESSVASAPFADAGAYNELKNMYGGFAGFSKIDLKKTARVIRDIVGRVAPIVQQVSENIPDSRAQAVAQVAKTVGKYANKRKGSGLSGGQTMSRRSLSQRAR